MGNKKSIQIHQVVLRSNPSSTLSNLTVLDRTEYTTPTMTSPKKYIKINGVMKMNPAYKTWKNNQAGGSGVVPMAAAVPTNPNALPVVSSMEDHMQMNQELGIDVPLADSTDAT